MPSDPPLGSIEPITPLSPSVDILTLSCPDQPGIVHAVSGAIVVAGGNIVESQQFGDPDTGRFFMRVAVEGEQVAPALRMSLTPVAARYGMDWRLDAGAHRTRTLVMVSRGGHCLNDLMFRTRAGQLPIEVPAVVSNHDTLRPMAEFYGVPYHHVPVTPDTRADAEARLADLLKELDIELVVLARYMQVLSDEVCSALPGRIINIHHSFLPSFKGARPYHQAHDRGVKLIGATAHYVTATLDEGPIIEQDVVRADHTMSPEALAGLGRDVEAQVLARAVRWHAEHRVILNGHRTVIFR